MDNAGWKISLTLLFLICSSGGILLALSGGPPPGVTGDFGEQNCNQPGCHVGNSLNAPGGSLTISGVPEGYEPGATYPITVTIDRVGQRRWGFELAVREVATGRQAGGLTVTDSASTQIAVQSGVQYIQHTSGGTQAGSTGPRSWSFNWTAPLTAVGQIRFSAAGNAANNDFNNTGDFIYTANATTNPATSQPTFTTALYFPRLVSTNGGGAPFDNSEFTGIAVANLDSEAANLRLTAYATEGAQIAGAQVENPAQKALAAGEQLPIVDTQVFGPGLPAQNPVGWLKLESTKNRTVGFFLMFNGSLTILDGADVSSATLTSFILPEIEDSGFTQIHIANPGTAAASANFELVDSGGTVRATANRTISANGGVAEFASALFPGVQPGGSDYIRVTSDNGVVPFEFLGKQGQYVEGLNGQDANAGGTTLFSPQYVVGGTVWRTTLSVVNLEQSAGNVTFRFIRDDGTTIGSERQVNIPARGKIYITDQQFFFDTPPTEQIQGYVEVTSSGPRLAGNVVFGDPARTTFSSALPLVSTLQNAVVFSQLASNETYFTGAAILNPGGVPANVTIDVFDQTGAPLATSTVSIPARQRQSQLLTQYFPELGGRGSGYFKLTSDQGIASFALFGTHTLSVLSAVPPQVVP
jgi:hypothetical protein